MGQGSDILLNTVKRIDWDEMKQEQIGFAGHKAGRSVQVFHIHCACQVLFNCCVMLAAARCRLLIKFQIHFPQSHFEKQC